jgi:hypothetical protein
MIQNLCQHINFLQLFLHMFMWCHFNGKLCMITNMDVIESKLNFITCFNFEF